MVAGLLEYVQLGIGAGAVVGAAVNADAKPALMPTAGAPIHS